MFARVKVEVPEHNGRLAQMHVATTTFVLPPWEQVSQNGWPLSLRLVVEPPWLQFTSECQRF